MISKSDYYENRHEDFSGKWGRGVQGMWGGEWAAYSWALPASRSTEDWADMSHRKR